MEMDPNPPSFNIPMNVGPLNLGQSYASGMQAGTQVGENIGKGISAAADVMMRNQRATDMLNAMHQGGMLSDQAYSSVAGKSLGAQEQMLGMYANEWIANQANQRALSLARGQAGIDVSKQHNLLLDVYNQAKAGNPAAVDVKKMFWQPGQNQSPGQNQAVQQPGQQPAAPIPMQSKAGGPWLPGTKYGYQTVNGKQVYGHMLPSGQFIPE